MFYPPDQFPFIAMLEQNWSVIHDEYSRLAATDFMAWPERQLYNKGWEVFGLYAWGRRIDKNCRLCPETARIVESIPGMVTAGFSQLAPEAHIQPHVGYTTAVLRCHLGIEVPEGCSLRVGSETRNWQTGRCFIFDDTIEHEAWNRSEAHRTVLLLDIKRPDSNSPIGVPSAVANQLEAITTGPK